MKNEIIKNIASRGSSHSVAQFWFKFTKKKHFKNQTVELTLTFLENLENCLRWFLDPFRAHPLRGCRLLSLNYVPPHAAQKLL